MRFEVCDLYDLPALDTGRFDVTFFNGIFYHLPNPVMGLKLAADLTDELLVLNTATMAGRGDGALVAARESPTKLMSGLYGLNWFPTGPRVLTRVLHWLGFPEVRCSAWREPPNQREGLGRIELLAARREGFFDSWDSALTDPAERFVEAVRTSVPPGARVLVPAAADIPALIDREAIVFTDNADVERHRADGVEWLALPDSAPAPAEELRARYSRVSRPGAGASVLWLGGP
jgi:hypothetical protein